MNEQIEQERPRPTAMERIVGGNPAGVMIRLVLMSLVVGFLMAVFGLDVQGLLEAGSDFVRETLRDSSGALRSMGGYVLTGAALVVPIWIIMRITSAGKRR